MLVLHRCSSLVAKGFHVFPNPTGEQATFLARLEQLLLLWRVCKHAVLNCHHTLISVPPTRSLLLDISLCNLKRRIQLLESEFLCTSFSGKAKRAKYTVLFQIWVSIAVTNPFEFFEAMAHGLAKNAAGQAALKLGHQFIVDVEDAFNSHATLSLNVTLHPG